MTASSHLLYASSNPIIFLFPDIGDEIMQLDNYSNLSCSYLSSHLYLLYNLMTVYHLCMRGRSGPDGIIVGLITTCVISA
jgi:hypothetical protein